MANFDSKQVTDDMPIPSHGDASSVKCQHYQVVLGGAAGAADTINFGDLPHYATPVEVLIRSTGAAVGLTVGIPADPNGFFDAAAVTANVPLRSVTGSLLGRNVGKGIRRVLGTVGTSVAAGTIDLFVFYVVEDTGVGYPFIAAA